VVNTEIRYNYPGTWSIGGCRIGDWWRLSTRHNTSIRTVAISTKLEQTLRSAQRVSTPRLYGASFRRSFEKRRTTAAVVNTVDNIIIVSLVCDGWSRGRGVDDRRRGKIALPHPALRCYFFVLSHTRNVLHNDRRTRCIMDLIIPLAHNNNNIIL